mgnify:CR=1 FL=1
MTSVQERTELRFTSKINGVPQQGRGHAQPIPGCKWLVQAAHQWGVCYLEALGEAQAEGFFSNPSYSACVFTIGWLCECVKMLPRERRGADGRERGAEVRAAAAVGLAPRRAARGVEAALLEGRGCRGDARVDAREVHRKRR